MLISCDQGLKAKNGAVGVGRGTTNAMVFSSLAILVANFVPDADYAGHFSGFTGWRGVMAGSGKRR